MSCHRDCAWNCGATDCHAPTGDYYVDQKADAIASIKKQPFFRDKIDFVFHCHWVTRQDLIDAGYKASNSD